MAWSDTKLSEHGTAPAPPLAPATGRSLTGLTPLAVAVFAYVLMLAIGKRLLGDPDTYLHIAAGNWMWAHGSVPPTDPFSFTFEGAPWIAHEWLSELIFAGAFAALGWAGVVALTAAAIALTFALLAQFLGGLLSRLAALLGVTLSYLLAAGHLIARPHILAMPVLVAWMICLERARMRRDVPPFILLPLMTLWANFHGSFVIGLGLAVLYAGEAVIAQTDWPARRQVARHWGLFLCGALVASLITPYGIEGPLFAFHLSRESFALSIVNEWRSTDFASFQPLELWIMALIVLGFTARLRLPMMKLLILIGLLHLALAHRRNTEMLALIAPILFAEPLLNAHPAIAALADRARSSAKHYLAAAAVVVVATGALAWHGIVHDEQNTAPSHAIAAATAAGVSGPVLNAYNFGGYLIFAGIPPFVDGRIDLYGDDFMHDYVDAVSAQGDALQNLLEKYHITWTLLEPSMTAVTLLDHLPGWERVYGDDDAVVHRRIAAKPGDEARHP